MYIRPPDCPAHRICKSGEYDVISDGYAVAPPSMHKSGRRYAWVTTPEDVTVAPRWAVEMLREASKGKEDQGNRAEDIPDAEPISFDFLDKLRKRDEALVHRITSEASAARAGADMKDDDHVDRSKNDWVIALRLLTLGYSPGVVLSVLTHSTWFSGSKARQQGAQYARTTISNAQEYLAHDSDRWFEGKTFVPQLFCAELLKDAHFVYVGEELRHYDGGVYRTGGAKVLRRLTQERLQRRWKSAHVNEVQTWVEDRSQADLEDLDHKYVNVKNGLLNLHTLETVPHDPEYISLAQLPVAFNPTADATEVDRIIGSVLPQDAVPVFWEAVGACLITDRYWPKFFLLLIGAKDSGKSVVLRAIGELLGKENVSAVTLKDLADNPFSRAGLVGRLANIAADLGPAEAQDVGWIKTLTGDDLVNVDRKHKEMFGFRNRAKMLFSANQFPGIRHPDEALFGRALVIICPHRFVKPGDKEWQVGDPTEYGGVAKPADTEVLDTLTTPDNLSAMLNRALEGLACLRAQGGFSESETVRRGRAEFRSAVDSVIDFIGDATVADEEAWASKEDYYAAYTAWSKESGRAPVGRTQFYRRVKENARALGLIESESGHKRGYRGRRITFVARGSDPLEALDRW
ncbi:MAG: DUF5906 domain-containing protein [Chloroflexota bacterium]|nr:DUF5906 domain-containing protein [Chloroflexota bacterium]